MNGLFITIEGPDGAGKTSVINELYPRLQLIAKKGIVKTREPGGVRISEKIRHIILNPEHDEMDERTEALLYAAARRQHLVEVILPAIVLWIVHWLIKEQDVELVWKRLLHLTNLPQKGQRQILRFI